MKNNKEKIEELFNYVVSKDYDVVVSHNEISEIIEEDIKTSKYYQIINNANKLLTEQGKMIESIKKVGYRIVNPNDYTIKSIDKMQQGFRKVSKGQKMLTYAPVKSMTEEARTEYNLVSDRVKLLNAHIGGAITEIKLLKRKDNVFNKLLKGEEQ